MLTWLLTAALMGACVCVCVIVHQWANQLARGREESKGGRPSLSFHDPLTSEEDSSACPTVFWAFSLSLPYKIGVLFLGPWRVSLGKILKSMQSCLGLAFFGGSSFGFQGDQEKD